MRSVIERAAEEAQEAGSRTIEAEHLLLAIAAADEDTTRELLAWAGLDHRAVGDALQREFEHSLGTAGVTAADQEVLRPRRGERRPSDAGTSAKLALERGMAAAGDKKDLRPAHILLGILELRAGTVPRALALAGVDRRELRARTQAAISDDGRQGPPEKPGKASR
ncbi:Clp protease [Actinomadura logoneensis]|uniref:Clp protease n=1 Tax=Actinomadura logoneensis TaxID=2293572 RepID=A0A372JAR9_9ACTN|nr:Clp protease [Actinomadura logoneensis]